MYIKNQKGFGAIEVILLLIIIGILGFVCLYVIEANKNINKSNSDTVNSSIVTPKKDVVKKTSNDVSTKITTSVDTETVKTESCSGSTDDVKAYIIKCLNAQDYASLSSVMEDKVTYTKQSSGSDGNSDFTKSGATHALENYFRPSTVSLGAQTPWNFDVMNSDAKFAANIGAANNPAFDNAYIGRSKDKNMFVAFKFSNSGKISNFWYGVSVYND